MPDHSGRAKLPLCHRSDGGRGSIRVENTGGLNSDREKVDLQKTWIKGKFDKCGRVL
jgi:hypothetical protein